MLSMYEDIQDMQGITHTKLLEADKDIVWPAWRFFTTTLEDNYAHWKKLYSNFENHLK